MFQMTSDIREKLVRDPRVSGHVKPSVLTLPEFREAIGREEVLRIVFTT